MLSETRTCIQGGEERRMISGSVSSEVKLMSIITHIFSTNISSSSSVCEGDNTVRKQIRLLDCWDILEWRLSRENGI